MDLNRIEARLMRGDAQLTEMRGKAAEVQSEMTSEYLGRIRNLEKIRNAFEEKHIQLQVASESVF